MGAARCSLVDGGGLSLFAVETAPTGQTQPVILHFQLFVGATLVANECCTVLVGRWDGARSIRGRDRSHPAATVILHFQFFVGATLGAKLYPRLR